MALALNEVTQRAGQGLSVNPAMDAQTTQGNRLSCRDQEGRRGSEEAAVALALNEVTQWVGQGLSVNPAMDATPIPRHPP